MKRGDVFDADLDPMQGSEQAGIRPVIVVSRDAINASSNVVIVVPMTTARPGRRVYPSQIVIHAPEGGLGNDSIALGEQVRAITKNRLGRHCGTLTNSTIQRLARALIIALDLPCP